MLPVVIFDIDGTLANSGHRQHFLPDDWDSFVNPEIVINDPPFEPIKRLAHILQEKYMLVVATGRAESDRPVTIEWLWKHNIKVKHIFMRPENDHREDDVVKLEMLEKMRAIGLEPWLVIDDRDRVVKAWRDAGLTCLQPAEGNF